MEREELRGKGLLKVVGIILIVLSCFAILNGALAPVLLRNLKRFTETTGRDIPMLSSITSTGLKTAITLITGAVELAVGILGVVFCNRQKGAIICLIGVIVYIVLICSNYTYSYITNTAGDYLRMPSLVIALVLPVLYLIGAILNVKTKVKTE